MNSRNRDVARKRQDSRQARTVHIPRPQDPARRQQLESDVFSWLKWYSGDVFTRDFTEQQHQMVLAILAAIEDGGDQAIAASRGEGKTTIAERVLGYCILSGRLQFAVLFSATGTDAEHSLSSIKQWLETNEALAADYPEVCAPLAALEQVPQRAHYMQATGEGFEGVLIRFKWCGREVVLPSVPGAPSAGAIIATRGLDGAVRGLKIGNRRPDLCVLDDPDTSETVNSDDQRDKLEAKIDKAIAGLGGQEKPLGRVLITTIQKRGTVSDRFTDSTVKPSWRGKRFRFLVTPPERTDLWAEYVQLRQADWVNGTHTAAAFLDEHFEDMHRGAVVGNEFRKPGGQRSALQYYYDEVARIGQDAVSTEYDNAPPADETGATETAITPHRVQRQLSGFERGVVPPEATLLVQGIDVRKPALHWCISAWTPDGSCYTVDYGIHETRGTTYGSDEGLDLAIRRAILERIEETKATKYAKPSGEVLPVELTLVDGGWQTPAVYAACGEAGLGVLPCMGFGLSAGCARANFSDIQRRSPDRKPGDGWFLSRKGKVWLAALDADRWKRFVHDRFMTAPGKPGCGYLFGQINERPERLSADEKQHHSFAHHVCSEVEAEEIVKGKLVRRWKTKSSNNHWLDALAYSCAAANIKGVKVLPAIKPSTTVGPVKSMRELAEQAASKRRAG